MVGEAQPTAMQAAAQVQLGDLSDVPILAAAIQCRADVFFRGVGVRSAPCLDRESLTSRS